MSERDIFGWFQEAKSKLEARHPEIATERKCLFDSIQTDEGKLKLARGLNYLAIVGGSTHLKLLAIVAMGSIVENNLDSIDALFGVIGKTNTQTLPIDGISDIPRQDNNKLALLLGHYRFLTPSSLANVIRAGEGKTLVVGIEAGERSREHKSEQLIFTDAERLDMFVQPGICEYVVLIDEIPYSNEGYRDLVRKISPDILYSSAYYPPEIREEMSYRAHLVGAEYCELPRIPGPSTTEIFQYTLKLSNIS